MTPQEAPRAGAPRLGRIRAMVLAAALFAAVAGCGGSGGTSVEARFHESFRAEMNQDYEKAWSMTSSMVRAVCSFERYVAMSAAARSQMVNAGINPSDIRVTNVNVVEDGDIAYVTFSMVLGDVVILVVPADNPVVWVREDGQWVDEYDFWAASSGAC